MRERPVPAFFLAALPAILFGSATTRAQAVEESISGAAVYEDYCEMCHEVEGVGIAGEIPPLVGNPNLEDQEYLIRVIREGVSGPIEVGGENYDDEMMGFPELSNTEVSALVEYIEGGFVVPTTAEETQSPQLEVVGDAARGAALFNGRQRLANDGPACLACHAAGAYGHLGGPGLGPDLSGLPDRFAGEKGLRSALRRPPSPVMLPLYAERELTEEEVADLAAFFGEAAAETSGGGADWLLVGGMIGALALFGVMAVFASAAHRRSYSLMLRDSR